MEDYKSCLEATQLENKIVHLNNKVDVKILIVNCKEFIKNNDLLKSKQVLKSERHVFTTEINKIALGSNDDKKYN